MKEAIKLAIGAGWDLKKSIKWPEHLASWPEIEEIAHKMYSEMIREDPLFWQALGKALGWTNNLWIGKMTRLLPDGGSECHNWELAYWEYEWHRFIDHLASGGDPDSFFTTLTTNHSEK